ncbi:hypothetical protein MHYP_G00050820 [Metynnis hypsauchen]
MQSFGSTSGELSFHSKILELEKSAKLFFDFILHHPVPDSYFPQAGAQQAATPSRRTVSSQPKHPHTTQNVTGLVSGHRLLFKLKLQDFLKHHCSIFFPQSVHSAISISIALFSNQKPERRRGEDRGTVWLKMALDEAL